MRLKFYAATPLVIRTSLFDGQLFFYNSRLRECLKIIKVEGLGFKG